MCNGTFACACACLSACVSPCLHARVCACACVRSRFCLIVKDTDGGREEGGREGEGGREKKVEWKAAKEYLLIAKYPFSYVCEV